MNDPDDVITAVRFARANGLTVAAQPGGHGGTRALDDTILLRTRGLGGIDVDVDARVAHVGAGVKWGELMAALQGTGLTGMVGSSPDTTVVGLSVGGGMSWFGRAYGLAADSIVALEMVDANGEFVRVTADSDPDLFWALRGGGGDFGIITAAEVALHPAADVYGGRLMWPIEHAPEVLRAFQAVTSSAPDELTVWFHILRFPPLPEIPEPIRGGSFVSFDLTFIGDGEAAEELIAPVRALPAPMIDTLGTADAVGARRRAAGAGRPDAGAGALPAAAGAARTQRWRLSSRSPVPGAVDADHRAAASPRRRVGAARGAARVLSARSRRTTSCSCSASPVCPSWWHR